MSIIIPAWFISGFLWTAGVVGLLALGVAIGVLFMNMAIGLGMQR